MFPNGSPYNKVMRPPSEVAVESLVDYDPFVRGRFPVGVRTFQLWDEARNRMFPCEIWYPAAQQHSGEDLAPEKQDIFNARAGDEPRKQMAVRDAAGQPGIHPLVIYSHHSGGHRRAATFLCTHLGSHGYVVAGLDHSETIAPELASKEGETAEQKAARWQAVIDARVPDTLLLLEHLLSQACGPEIEMDARRIGIVGHSFGGWTALAAPDFEPRIRAVVAHAPGGSSNPRPGILPGKLHFNWGRDVPTLYLVAEADTLLPLAGMHEIFERTPATKQMVILRRADHMHFMDNVEQMHELLRTMPLSAELAWMQEEMCPIGELCSGEQAQLLVRGLTLSHLDATLRQKEEAQQFLAGDLEADLGKRRVEALVAQAMSKPKPTTS